MMPFSMESAGDWPVAVIDVGGGVLRAGCLMVARFPTPWGTAEMFTTIQLMGYGADGRLWALEFGCTGFKNFDSVEMTWHWDEQYAWMERFEWKEAGS